jgi:hypothetical protein
MTIDELIRAIIESDPPISARRLIEASVHLPRRGRRWVAAFRDAYGRPMWLTTGLEDREAALAVANELESTYRRKQAAESYLQSKPKIRVRRGTREKEHGCLTQAEVASILRISERAVREIEHRAIEKLRKHPALRAFWRQWLSGEIDESNPPERELTPAEIRALFALARSTFEGCALMKLLSLVGPC